MHTFLMKNDALKKSVKFLSLHQPVLFLPYIHPSSLFSRYLQMGL